MRAPAAAAPPAVRRPRFDFAREVIDLLTAALARDDERRGLRCPTCGRRWQVAS